MNISSASFLVRVCFLAGLALLAPGASGNVGAGLPGTIERVKHSVVAVGTYQRTRSPAFTYRGTGFVVGNGTLVATNAHVLPERVATDDREALVVVTSAAGGEPQVREAKFVAADKAHDLALLRITGAPLPALDLHDSSTVREGQVFAFTGFPLGNTLGLMPVTHRGMISSVTPIAMPSATAQQLNEKVIRSIKAGVFQVYQLDATAYPGSSGSPMYDVETGRVVGIINMVFVRGTRESAVSNPSGITFAVPVRFLRELISQRP